MGDAKRRAGEAARPMGEVSTTPIGRILNAVSSLRQGAVTTR